MSKEAQYYRLAMRIFADFSGTIALPAVGAALLGQWIDEGQGTEPRYLIILLVLAFALSAYIVVRKAKKYLAAYEKLIRQEK
jgi:F0F1-type ATP synthase assembly protein I